MKKQKAPEELVVSLSAAEVVEVSESLHSIIEMWTDNLKYVTQTPVGYEDAREWAQSLLTCTGLLVKLHPRQAEKPVKKSKKV